MISALQLARSPAEQPDSIRLQKAAVADGARAARLIPLSTIIPRGILFDGAALLLCLLVLPSIYFFSKPQPASMVLIRLIDPAGDHPPAHNLTFEWSLNPDADRLLLGDDLEVTATVRGWPILDAAFLIDAGDESQPARISVADSAPRDADHSEFRLTLHDLRAPLRLRLETSRGTSAWHTVTPRPAPRLRLRSLHIHPPEGYDAQPVDAGIYDPDSPVSLLVGSRVEILAGSDDLDLPAHDVTASPPAHATLETMALSPREFRTTALITAPGEIRLRLGAVADNGHSAPEPLEVTLRAHTDAPPRIEWSAPDSNAALLEGESLPVQIRVRDDVSVRSVTLAVRRLLAGAEDGTLQSVTLPLLDNPTAPGADEEISARLDLSPLNLRPGETIALRAEAADGRPDSLGGPHTAATAPRLIEIIDQAAYDALVEEARSVRADVEPVESDPVDALETPPGEAPTLPGKTQGQDAGAPAEGQAAADADPSDRRPPSGDSAAGAAPGSRRAVFGPQHDQSGNWIGEGTTMRSADSSTDVDAPFPLAAPSMLTITPGGHGAPADAAALLRLPPRYRELAARYALIAAREAQESP